MMAGLSINWQWANPNVVVPQGSRFRTSGAYDAAGDVADAITKVKQSNYREEQNRLAQERQQKLDEWAEDDRTRKLAEEQRIANVRKEMSDTINSDLRNTKNLEALKAQRNDITAKIQQIKAKWGLQ
jgi:superfamily I DNA and RNA helicase